MSSNFYFDFFLVDQFARKPTRRSKKRDKELRLIKKHGQVRRVLISPEEKVLRADLPLFEALIKAGYGSIAVVVIGRTEPADIKAAKTLSAQIPLPDCFRADGHYPNPFLMYEQSLYATRCR
jgi:hypothetical protein